MQMPCWGRRLRRQILALTRIGRPDVGQRGRERVSERVSGNFAYVNNNKCVMDLWLYPIGVNISFVFRKGREVG